jgi:hypothetical protein
MVSDPIFKALPINMDNEMETRQPRRKKREGMEDNMLRTPRTRMDGGLREGGANVDDVYKTYE